MGARLGLCARGRVRPSWGVSGAVGWVLPVQDILCRITVENCSSDREETLHVLPHLLFRNNWSWGYDVPRPKLWKVTAARPRLPGCLAMLRLVSLAVLILPLLCWYRQADVNRVTGEENHLGKVHFFCQAAAAGAAAPGASDAPWLFTENETNYTRLYGVSVAHVSVAAVVCESVSS